MFLFRLCYNKNIMDPKQTPPVGVSSNDINSSATGRSLFANSTNRFRDTTPKGDIIIPPSGPAPRSRGSKRPLLIAVAVVLLIAATGLIVFFATRGSGNGENGGGFFSFINSSGNNRDIIASANDFNAYANYIITGEASTNRLTEDLKSRYENPESEENFAIYSAFYDGNADFMDAAKQYFDTFYKAYQSEKDEDALSGTITEYADVFNFIYQYTKTRELSSEEILAAYLSGADLETTISAKYAPYTEMNNPIASDFVERAAARDRLVFNLDANYSAAGCIIDGAVSPSCAENIATLNPTDLIEQIHAADINVSDFIGDTLDETIYKCWLIDSQIYDLDGTETENTNADEELDLEIPEEESSDAAPETESTTEPTAEPSEEGTE